MISEWITEKRITLVAFSPTQPLLAIAEDDEIFIWNWQIGEEIGQMIGKRHPAEGCFVVERDESTGRIIRGGCRSPARVYDMEFTPDGRFLIVGSMRSEIEVWNVDTRQLVGHIGKHPGNWVDGVAISPDGRYIASFEKMSANVYVWNWETKQLLWTRKCGYDIITEISFSPDNLRIYVSTHTTGLRKTGTDPWVGWDDKVRIWDVETGRLIDTYETEFKRLTSVIVSPNGKSALVKYSDGVVLFDIQQKTIINKWSDFISDWPAEVQLSPDGKTVVSVSRDFIKTWDVTTQQMQLLISAEDYEFDGFAISPDSKRFAVGKDPFVEIRDIQTGNVESRFLDRISSLRHIAYSPTGRRLGVVSFWKDILILNTIDPNAVQRLDTELGIDRPYCHNVAFSENDRFFAATCEVRENNISENYLVLWKREINNYVFHSSVQIQLNNAVPAFTTLGDGSTIVAVADWDETDIFKILDKRVEHISSLDAGTPIQFAQDSRFLLANYNENFQIWDWKRNRQIRHQQYPRYVSLSGNGAVLLSYNIPGQYQIWDIERLITNLPYSIEAQDKLFVTLGQIKRNQLLQNYPNPFNPETWIPFKLADESQVIIDIYNSTGELVRSLSQGKMKVGDYSAQSDAVHWDGKNDNGEAVSSGIYYYTINAGGFSATRKMHIRK